MRLSKILILVFAITLGVGNLYFVSLNRSSIISNAFSLEALAQNEGSVTVQCPGHKCDPGGCGSSSCSIEVNYPLGYGTKKTVTAQDGHFACCYKDWLANTYAKTYSNKCCIGPVWY